MTILIHFMHGGDPTKMHLPYWCTTSVPSNTLYIAHNIEYHANNLLTLKKAHAHCGENHISG